MSSFDAPHALGLPELPAYLERVEQRMADVLASDNEHLQDSVSHLLQVRGKRLRPSLLIAVAASQGRKIDGPVIAGCAAVELVHLASLVHDDIMDDADTRWGIPTISAKEGIGQAILVGDYLLAKACQEAATVSAEAAHVIASVIAALVDGQAREFADKYNAERTQESYLQAIKGKTASLFSASCRIGAMCAGSTPAECARFADFGEKFGIAFQLIDDVLDFVSSQALSGKPVGNDVVEGVYTMPLLLALHGPQSRTVRALLGTRSNDSRALLAETLEQTGSIEKAIAEARKFSQAATNIIEDIANLRPLPDAYVAWALENLVRSR